MNSAKLLEKIGLEPQEAKVYLSVLTLGETPVAEIAKHAGVVRTSCYYTLQKLQQKGIAHPYVKRGVRYWGVEGPRWLASRIDEQRNVIDTLMPQLLTMQSTFGAKPSTTYYEGVSGVKQVLNDILKDRHNLLAMCSVEDAEAVLGQPFELFISKRVKQKLFIRFITNKTPATIKLQELDEAQFRHTHFLPAGKEINSINFIYGDKVATISLNRRLPMAVIVQDPEVAHTQRILFEALWKDCSHYADQQQKI